MAFFARPRTTQVRIANPDTQEEATKSPARKDSVQRQCRNVMIYGYCKFQDKGCQFYHPSAEGSVQQIQQQTPSTTPASEPARTPGALSAQAVNAPVFVPKSAAAAPVPPPAAKSPSPVSPTDETQLPVAAEPASPLAGLAEYQEFQPAESYDPYALSSPMQAVQMESQYYDEGQYNPYTSHYDPSALDVSYFNPSTVYMRQPLDYHLYTPAPHSAFVASAKDSYFVPASMALRQTLQMRGETIRGIAPPGSKLPEELQGYHTLVPLDAVTTGSERRRFGNWYSVVYRAIRTSNGLPFALRRIENYRLMHQSAFAAIEFWQHVKHPAIIPVCEAFTTRSFNDSSLVVVHEYYANAQTLYDVHFKPKPPPVMHYKGRLQTVNYVPSLVPERTLWSYIVQIASAVKKVHDAGQAVRMIDVSKILVTGQNRVRISSCGVIDLLTYDTRQDVGLLQQEDLTMFGRLIFMLCCCSLGAWNPANFQKSIEIMTRVYSPEIKAIAIFLISKGGPHKSVDQVLDMARSKVIAEMDDALLATDRLEFELLGELENARLVRLLCKFGFINERPEFAREPRWSETGDRYIIKLFRDYVFHQVDENGNPVLNLSHVLTCLNKLDAGTDEKVMLISRDEQSCLVVSYKEIKACIASAFAELARGTTADKP